ncbi:tail protein X [uncultured Tistrella sp.]|uniref:tail protein X n=1 Tax=Tistrella mobilis TaxID=171437 RepID=UPI000C091475|nr:tail protein X [uncultured Tistrella sp.]MAM73387.1 phage tail protein [Tistrella sp.]
MTTLYRTIDGDVLDRICWRHYGRHDVVAEVLAANPGLAGKGPVYPANLAVLLPDVPRATAGRTIPVARERVRLWD